MFFSLSSMFAKNTKRNVYTAEAVREYIFRLRFHSRGRLKHRGKRRNKRIEKWKMHQACSFFLVRWWVAFVKTAEQGISCWRWLRGLIIISRDRQQLASGSCCGQAARLIAAHRGCACHYIVFCQYSAKWPCINARSNNKDDALSSICPLESSSSDVASYF